MENLMMPLMYDIPSRDDVAEVIITGDCVNGVGEAKIISKETESL